MNELSCMIDDQDSTCFRLKTDSYYSFGNGIVIFGTNDRDEVNYIIQQRMKQILTYV